MGTLLAGWWSAIWPNLAANVLWVPLAWVHHRLMRRQADQHHEAMKAHVTAALGAGSMEEAS